jgi:hypothetical protein
MLPFCIGYAFIRLQNKSVKSGRRSGSAKASSVRQGAACDMEAAFFTFNFGGAET